MPHINTPAKALVSSSFVNVEAEENEEPANENNGTQCTGYGILVLSLTVLSFI